MYNRYLSLKKEVGTSIFLFGARQTGKSTLLERTFPDALYIDLLDSGIRNLYLKRPALLYEQCAGKPEGTLIVIDEITEVPDLLNEVHRLISRHNLKFVLCASSARKLWRKGYNTLGGRAYPCYFYPLVSQEIPDFSIEKAVNHGMLPPHYTANDKMLERLLSSYVDIYLREEIRAEAIIRNLQAFQRFLEVAALTDGEMVNYSNIANDCNVSSTTVKEYFTILQETLVGYMVPAYTKTLKRRLVQAPRFYFFDVGIVNHLLHRRDLVRGTVEFGHAFEHLVIQELIAYIGYTHNSNSLSYWRTYSGLEVDAVIGEKCAIEIKSVEEVQNKHLKGLKAFRDDHPDYRFIITSFDRINRTTDGIEVIYIYDFLRQLWSGELF